MNALQWIVKEAKGLKKKFPKRYSTWKEYVAQASAIYASKHKGKSPVGKKHKVGYKANRLEIVKKATPLIKKFVSKGSTKKDAIRDANIQAAFMSGYKHTDTKSHNVNIKVGSVKKIKFSKASLDKTQQYYKYKGIVYEIHEDQDGKPYIRVDGKVIYFTGVPRIGSNTVGALPINFTGSFLGYKFSVYNQYRIDGGVTAVLLDPGKNKIAELNGRKEEEERAVNALFVNSITYNKTQHQQPFYLGQKEERELKEKIKRFVVQLNKEVKDYNSGKDTKLKKAKPVKYTATVKKLSLINEIKKLLYDNKKILKGGYVVKPGHIRNFSPSEISGIPHKSKYFITYKSNGVNKIEYFEKYPTGYYKGMDRIIYVMRLTDSGTALIPLQLSSNNSIVKK